MKKTFNLFKIIKNLFGRKKLSENSTPLEEVVKVKKKTMGGVRFTETRFTASHFRKKHFNKRQGNSRNINHKLAA